MKCPKCDDHGLTRLTVGEIEVDHCTDCGGLWLDQSELPRLLALDRAEVKSLLGRRGNPGFNSTRGDCPRCATPLLRVNSAAQREVTLDKCAGCGGVWLDGGELKRLMADDE